MATMERFGPTRRGGPLFRWLGEPLAIDLANTVMVVRPGEDGEPVGDAGGPSVDLLAEPADLRQWLSAESERLGGFEVDAGEDLGAIWALREVVRTLFAAAAEGRPLPPAEVGLLNEASAASPVAAQLTPSVDGAESAAHGFSATPLVGDHSLAGLRAAIARSAIDLLASTPAGEMRICRAPSCGMFYLGARRWCCSACGNRARAARHYRRRRDAPDARAPRRGASQ